MVEPGAIWRLGFRRQAVIAYCCRIWLAVACALPEFACHAEAAWVLPKGSSMHTVARQATMLGAPADVLSYEAPMDAPALIAFLSRKYPTLRDMAVFPGMAVLSDDSGPCTRMVTVSGGGGRSSGTLSTICWERAMAKPVSAAAWLPAGAKLVFEFAEPQSQAGSVQQIWQYQTSSGDVARQMRGNFVRQGWTLARGSAGSESSSQTWQRGSETVIVDVLGKDEGCILAVLRFASEAPEQGVAP
jgi:hypothetical protein